MLVAGIDVGLSGAIATFDDGQLVRAVDMPVLAVGTKNEIDEQGVLHIIAGSGHVFIEKAQTMPDQGIASSGHYMCSYGILRGICVGLGIPYTLVHPKTWKGKMMPDMPKEKQASIFRCKQLFPGIACLERKKDHGRADAILLALFGLRYILGRTT
jgi:hypothetical protein